jgi:fumarylpyruvate hydrolase
MDLCLPAPRQPLVAVADGAGAFPVHRIYCVGRNYEDHAKEMGFTGREPPFFFAKPADAVVPIASGATAELAFPGETANLHHEVELVVAIGKRGARIASADAESHIWGYAVGLDMTRRDLQTDMKKQGRPWEVGKSYDESAPISPIRPLAAGGPVGAARIWLSVNGVRRQESDVSKLIWNVEETIEHLSRYFELVPGDLIFTGTPEGVAACVRGDVLEGRVEGVGTVSTRLV